MKTSHVRNRPFDFRLIDLVEEHPVLYERQRGLNTFQMMKIKTELWTNIGNQLGCRANFCLMRWNNLRGQFQKEYRRTFLSLKNDEVQVSTWPYFHRLSFLEKTLQCNRKLTKQWWKNANTSNEVLEPTINEAQNETQILEDLSNCSNIDNYSFTALDELLLQESEVILEPEKSTVEEQETTNLEKIYALLKSLSEENQRNVEKRIMAYLCNFQLRCINNQEVDDLQV